MHRTIELFKQINEERKRREVYWVSTLNKAFFLPYPICSNEAVLLKESTQCIVCTKHNSVQSLSHVRLFVTPWTAAHQASLSITNSQSLPKLMSIESVMPANHLKSLLQHSSKAPILQCSAFFIVQLSYPYMTTGKTIALTRQTFVDKVSAF